MTDSMSLMILARTAWHEVHENLQVGPWQVLSRFEFWWYIPRNHSYKKQPNISFRYKQLLVHSLDKDWWLHTPQNQFGSQAGNGCYFRPGRPGFTAGWDIGHGHITDRTQICIGDHLSNIRQKYIRHDPDLDHSKLRGKWTHYAVVFNRDVGRFFRQAEFADIRKVTGSINNKLTLDFGTVYGWKTDGSIDEYRLYNIALNDHAARLIYNDHQV